MAESWNSPEKFNSEALQWDDNPRRRALALKVATAIITAVEPLKTMHALEFGCGTGLVTLEIAPLVGSLRAIDTSREMLGVLQEKIRHAGISNIETACLDLSSPLHRGEPEEKFDLIYSNMTLHHIADTAGFLNRLSTILLSGGILAIADLDQEDGLFHDDPEEQVHHGFERTALAELLQSADFEEISFKTAFVMEKLNREGKNAAYPIFLVTAKKSATDSTITPKTGTPS
ncbi:MAG: class I SAM-dependent methyltransferase [Chlorobium sp.]|nr:MAG: class I SAM-dependent methyltransferase [Chlorobium sp.]